MGALLLTPLWMGVACVPDRGDAVPVVLPTPPGAASAVRRVPWAFSRTDPCPLPPLGSKVIVSQRPIGGRAFAVLDGNGRVVEVGEAHVLVETTAQASVDVLWFASESTPEHPVPPCPGAVPVEIPARMSGEGEGARGE